MTALYPNWCYNEVTVGDIMRSLSRCDIKGLHCNLSNLLL